MPNRNIGQAYLDILIAIAIFLILASVLFTLTASALETITYSQARITARHLAQEKIELIRNLPYANVGTIGGIPYGPLPQSENISRNGLNYYVKTSIVYIDEPFDQLAPDDILPIDHKKVRVDVSWEGLAASRKKPITLITDIAPKGVETTEGGGTLSILVFDADGEPIPQAEVTIVAEEVNPPVNLSLNTSDNGRIILPGALACNNCYKILATKEGYSSEKTYSTDEIANPDKPHQNVLEGKLTEISFAIDKLSSLTVLSTQDAQNNFASLPNKTFRLKSDKTIGTDINDEFVYKFEKEFTTDNFGQLIITDLEWGNYQLLLPQPSDWVIFATNPLLPLIIFPNQEYQLSFALTGASENSFLASFVDTEQTPIASVSALLSDGAGFEASASSGVAENPDFGQAFFADLEAKNYLLQATAAGFLEFTNNIEISGEAQKTFILSGEE